jgi:hypothetical protein
MSYNLCFCYPWEMELNVGLDASFGNMEDCEGIRKKSKRS